MGCRGLGLSMLILYAGIKPVETGRSCRGNPDAEGRSVSLHIRLNEIEAGSRSL